MCVSSTGFSVVSKKRPSRQSVSCLGKSQRVKISFKLHNVHKDDLLYFSFGAFGFISILCFAWTELSFDTSSLPNRRFDQRVVIISVISARRVCLKWPHKKISCFMTLYRSKNRKKTVWNEAFRTVWSLSYRLIGITSTYAVFTTWNFCHLSCLLHLDLSLKLLLCLCPQSQDGRFEVRGRHGKSVLTISGVRLSDLGRFDCEALSRIGGHQKSMFLDIECKRAH